MEDDGEIIVELLQDLFGKEKQHYKNKGNLEINYNQHVFKCWSCGDVNEMKGPLGKLIDQYANKKQKKIYSVFKPEETTIKEVKKPKLRLPESFVKFSDSSPIYPVRRQAYNYLQSRGIGDDIIEKYGIGFCDTGSHSGRIVVPSYDNNDELTYYIARSWDPRSKSKYKNPEAEKDKIIFNERLIDWNKNIYLVEGVFDSFFLDNSIAMLGKHMSDLLFNSIYTKSNGFIIVALDGDAFKDAVKIYRTLNGGKLYGKIKILKLPEDKDICDLKGKIDEYYVNIKD